MVFHVALGVRRDIGFASVYDFCVLLVNPLVSSAPEHGSAGSPWEARSSGLSLAAATAPLCLPSCWVSLLQQKGNRVFYLFIFGSFFLATRLMIVDLAPRQVRQQQACGRQQWLWADLKAASVPAKRCARVALEGRMANRNAGCLAR